VDEKEKGGAPYTLSLATWGGKEEVEIIRRKRRSNLCLLKVREEEKITLRDFRRCGKVWGGPSTRSHLGGMRIEAQIPKEPSGVYSLNVGRTDEN